jgi:phage/plasmid-like protein (TIGR03299 family)
MADKKTINTMQEKIFDLLNNTGLNWEVSKEPLFASDGTETSTYGIFKKTERKHLGSVGERYEVYQNWQMAEALLIASQEVGIEFEKGGELNGGRKVFLQAKLQDEYVGKSGVKRFITSLNSHDGSSSIGLGSSNIVVVCQNTFHKAMQEITKVRHTSSAPERIKTLARELSRVIRADEFLFRNFKHMADTQLKDEMIERVLRKVFSVEANTNTKDISTIKKNQIESFAGALQTEISLEGANVWGLFNAVTRYTNHISAPKRGKDEYLMTGGGYKMSNLTYDTLCDMLGLEKQLFA